MGSGSSYRATPDELSELRRCLAGAVSTDSDVAMLSSISSQLEELGHRITEMAERYGATPDSALASELFGAELGLIGARRSLDRARKFLTQG
jgi:hypothetical protein